MDILKIFSTPSILHSDNGREFVNKVTVELANLWDGIKLVYGKQIHSQCQGSVERDKHDF